MKAMFLAVWTHLYEHRRLWVFLYCPRELLAVTSHCNDFLHYLPRSGNWVASWLPMPAEWEEGTEISLASDENLSMCSSLNRREETLSKQ